MVTLADGHALAPQIVGRHSSMSAGSGLSPVRPYAVPSPDREGPASGWTVDPSRAMLLVHDMQAYFLAVLDQEKEPASRLVSGVRALLRAFRAAGAPVVFSAQPGAMDRAGRGLLHDFWGPGMERSPESVAIADEVAPRAGEEVITKWRYSAFQRTPLLERLRSSERDQLVICGVYGHVGILGTALDAFAHDIQPFVVGDAIADFSAEAHESTLAYTAARCGRVLSSSTLLVSFDQ